MESAERQLLVQEEFVYSQSHLLRAVRIQIIAFHKK